MINRIINCLKNQQPLTIRQIAKAVGTSKKEVKRILKTNMTLFQACSKRSWTCKLTNMFVEQEELINKVKTCLKTGRIAEISGFSENILGASPANLTPEQKIALLCATMKISTQDLDIVISSHSEVKRTITGHTFEVVFDTMMHRNGIVCTEVGGDSNIDRTINGHSLQLKTPYTAGCSENIVSYKTHKTHGAKSQNESVGYYHKVEDFADFLIGLVSYHPFKVLIIEKEQLPRVEGHTEYILSPMYVPNNDPTTINAFEKLGIAKELVFPDELLNLEKNECLPISSNLLGIKSDLILRSIFIEKNFRIWDMNMRGFIREHILKKSLNRQHIHVYPPNVTGLGRTDKCDIVLKKIDDSYVRFQVKGLTWKGCSLKGADTIIDCETQLSRGHYNDHPTQSRLYLNTDFDNLIIAIEPLYSNQLSLAATGREDFNWNFYCIPQEALTNYRKFSNRVAPHQLIKYIDLQQYKIGEEWFEAMKKED